MTAGRFDCAVFEAAADELALGLTVDSGRDALLDHAASCARCGTLLRDLGTTVDALLTLAPEVEPPVGFESRAIAGMRPPARTAVSMNDVEVPAPAVRRRRRRNVVVAGAAAVAALLVAVGLVVARTDDPSSVADTVAAPLYGRSGTVVGRVELVSAPTPRVVVLVEGDDDWSGSWGCELLLPGGRWVEVGRWTAEEASGGVWATRIPASHLDALAMRVTAGGGTVIAEADLS